MMNLWTFNKKILLLVLILFVLPLLIVAFSSLSKIGKVGITVNVAPSTAKLYVDARKVSPGDVYVRSGHHRLEAKLDGFNAYSKEFDTDNSPKKVVYDVLLSPKNTYGQSILDDNPKLQQERENMGGAKFSQNSQALNVKYPFLKDLPLEGQRFTVNYGDAVESKIKDGDVAIALYVSVTDPSEKRNAIRSITEQLGVEPSDIEIIFTDYFNPITVKGNNESSN
ncbi:MAG: hypothetical protein QFB86_02805 [Patescibacteria group bacterium]|nr:hypothetical protein [Patescibacteria group bacterium]